MINPTNTTRVRATAIADILGDTSDFMQAVAHNKKSIAEIIFEDRPVDINEARSLDGMTALMLAAREGNLEMVEWLISLGAMVNVATTNSHETPLMMAVRGSHYNVVELLLKTDSSNINAKSSLTNKSSLRIAAQNMDGRMVDILLSNNANVSDDDLEMLKLIELSRKESISIEDLKNLFTSGIALTKKFLANPLITDRFDRHSVAFATLLLSDKILADKIIANFNERNSEEKISDDDYSVALAAIDPKTALACRVFSVAVRKGDYEVIENLLKGGIDPNITCYNTNKYKTLNALMHAARVGDLKMAQLLYKYGADENFICEGRDPLTPLEFAVKYKHQDVAFFIAVKEGYEKFVCESLIDFAIDGSGDDAILMLLNEEEIQAKLSLREVALLSLILPKDEELRDMIIANCNSRNSYMNDDDVPDIIDRVIGNAGEKLDAIANVIFTEAKNRNDFVVLKHLASRGFIAAQNYIGEISSLTKSPTVLELDTNSMLSIGRVAPFSSDSLAFTDPKLDSEPTTSPSDSRIHNGLGEVKRARLS